ncbi:hypothetical protein [Priestia aryabhattai]|uniref:RiboL-PSP-HEPN domain-containing protein n=1 Tax=Priestia aryabhattai TaxID=412384 RepID=A0ABD7WU76_PRIAR|nr:hypothetical protein [Priestia aryabhattai]WEA43818.1 hypothetical protein PWO00_23785 [Priestia aryabhattai]
MIKNKFIKNIHLTLMGFEVDSFRDYAKYIESSFQKELSFFEEGAKDLPEEIVDEYWDHYIDEAIQYSKDFPRIMRNSLFVSIYSFLEDKIVELCTSNDDSGGNPNFWNIKKAIDYLKKDLGLDVPKGTKEWQYITHAIRIRNCIVHCNGVVSRSSDRVNLENSIKAIDFVNQEDGRIILDSGFCLEFLENVHSFLRQLYQIEN